jgi:hypothetical protein
MSNLTLAQRLLVRIGQISQRSDVVVHQQSASRASGKRLSKWQSKLPADMYAFYQSVNGLKFHYGFADTADSFHGLEFVALEEDGRKMIDTFRNIYRVPHQAAKRYPNYFFQEGELDPNASVLFFFGDDGAWGLIMTGEGENASFHHWDNDGFVKPRGSSFTELVEKLIDHGFAHTWAYSETHPETDEVLKRLAIPSPPRKTFNVTIESLTQRSAEETRLAIVSSWSEEVRDKILRALGMTKQAKGLSSQEKIAFIEKTCASIETITEKVATAVMNAIGLRKRNRDEFAEFFRCGACPVATAKIRIEYIDGPIPLQPYENVLLRVLHHVNGFHVTDGLPWPAELLSYTNPQRHNLQWTPFLSCSWDYEFKGEKNKVATFDVVMDAARAEGMEVGKTYASTALPSVEGRIG